MTTFRKILKTILLGIIFSACSQTIQGQDSYPKDTTISNSKGIPKDSLSFYFPTSIKLNGQTIKTDIDSFELQWYSCDLYNFKEPILYNFYQGHDTYRFLWIRTFHRPVVFTLTKTRDNVSLTIKELDRHPRFLEMTYISFNAPEKKNKKHNQDKLSKNVKSKPDRFAKIVVNETKILTLTEWNKFESLLAQSNFWTMKPMDNNLRGLDGAEWIIEAHLQDKYYFVGRWSPDNSNFSNCGKYLIELSGQEYEIY